MLKLRGGSWVCDDGRPQLPIANPAAIVARDHPADEHEIGPVPEGRRVNGLPEPAEQIRRQDPAVLEVHQGQRELDAAPPRFVAQCRRDPAQRSGGGRRDDLAPAAVRHHHPGQDPRSVGTPDGQAGAAQQPQQRVRLEPNLEASLQDRLVTWFVSIDVPAREPVANIVAFRLFERGVDARIHRNFPHPRQPGEDLAQRGPRGTPPVPIRLRRHLHIRVVEPGHHLGARRRSANGECANRHQANAPATADRNGGTDLS